MAKLSNNINFAKYHLVSIHFPFPNRFYDSTILFHKTWSYIHPSTSHDNSPLSWYPQPNAISAEMTYPAKTGMYHLTQKMRGCNASVFTVSERKKTCFKAFNACRKHTSGCLSWCYFFSTNALQTAPCCYFLLFHILNVASLL